jgi:hypothetical protein
MVLFPIVPRKFNPFDGTACLHEISAPSALTPEKVSGFCGFAKRSGPTGDLAKRILENVYT